MKQRSALKKTDWSTFKLKQVSVASDFQLTVKMKVC